jgi:hypothetical protein
LGASAPEMSGAEPLEKGEHGVIVNTLDRRV